MVLEYFRDAVSERFEKLGYQLLDEDAWYGQKDEMEGSLLLKYGKEIYLVSITYHFRSHAITNVTVGWAGKTDKDKLEEIVARGNLPRVDETTLAKLRKDISNVYRQIISEEGIQFETVLAKLDIREIIRKDIREIIF